MTDFFKIKFHISSIDGDPIPDCLGEIITYIRKWLTDKYRSEAVKQFVPDWSLFYTGGSFGTDGSMGGFSAETTGFVTDEGWGEAWACKIIEYPWQNMKYIPRKWITDIGIFPISPSRTEISYAVQYEDITIYKGKPQNKPSFNIPNVAKYIITSDKWISNIDVSSLTAEQTNSKESLFDLAECKRLRETQLARGTSDNDAHLMDTARSWMSLCKVNRPDKNQHVWMLRLADVVNGSLVVPEFDEAKDKIFDNRTLIFCEDGPDMPDTLGFWEWSERKSESGKWLSDATYLYHPVPTEIIVLQKATNVIDVVDTLKSGVHIPAYIRSNLFFATKKDGIYEGVLCEVSFFDAHPGNETFYTIKNNIFTLPYYKISESDVFIWKLRKICKQVDLGEPLNRVQVCDFSETVKQMILQRMTWPIFKAQGIAKSDWQKFKQFLSEITEESIVDQLAEMYNMSLQEAHDCIDSFLQSVDSHIKVEDFDSALVAQIFSSHAGLKKHCTALAYEQWCTEHQAEIVNAQNEVLEIREHSAQEITAAQQELSGIRESITTAKVHHEGLLAEISSAQARIDQISSEIEEYERLGNESIVAVRRKIAEAQQDMAGFIADISVFLPPSLHTPVESQKRVTCWKYECAPIGGHTDEEIELSENWKSEHNALSQNLAHSLTINGELGDMLSAFLYAAYVNKVPLLIAGPAGYEVADVIAASIHASNAGHLWIGNDPSNNIAEEIAKYDEIVISVQNMFGKGWHDELPQSLSKLKKQIIWSHPYVEDIAMEPKGLFNYMLPVLSECFVGSLPALEMWPSKRIDGFNAYASTKNLPLKVSAFKKLKLSKLLTNRLMHVLSDAKIIFDQPAKEKDMEIMLGLLPLCVVTGQLDILKEAIETESGISSTVKTEVMRYIEEE